MMANRQPSTSVNWDKDSGYSKAGYDSARNILPQPNSNYHDEQRGSPSYDGSRYTGSSAERNNGQCLENRPCWNGYRGGKRNTCIQLNEHRTTSHADDQDPLFQRNANKYERRAWRNHPQFSDDSVIDEGHQFGNGSRGRRGKLNYGTRSKSYSRDELTSEGDVRSSYGGKISGTGENHPQYSEDSYVEGEHPFRNGSRNEVFSEGDVRSCVSGEFSCVRRNHPQYLDGSDVDEGQPFRNGSRNDFSSEDDVRSYDRGEFSGARRNHSQCSNDRLISRGQSYYPQSTHHANNNDQSEGSSEHRITPRKSYARSPHIGQGQFNEEEHDEQRAIAQDGYDSLNEDQKWTDNARYNGGTESESNDLLQDLADEDNEIEIAQRGEIFGNEGSVSSVERLARMSGVREFGDETLQNTVFLGDILKVLIRTHVGPICYWVVLESDLKYIKDWSSHFHRDLLTENRVSGNPEEGNRVKTYYKNGWICGAIRSMRGNRCRVIFEGIDDQPEIDFRDLIELPGNFRAFPCPFKVKFVDSTPDIYDELQYNDRLTVKIVSWLDHATMEVVVIPDENPLKSLEENETTIASTRMDMVERNVPLMFFISVRIDDHHYWVIQDRYNYLLSNFTEKLGKSDLENLEQITTGIMAIGLWKDGKWYRCQVENISGNVATVFFVDFGNRDKVGLINLKAVPLEFQDEPPFAVKVKIPDDCHHKYTRMQYGDPIKLVVKSREEDYLDVDIIDCKKKDDGIEDYKNFSEYSVKNVEPGHYGEERLGELKTSQGKNFSPESRCNDLPVATNYRSSSKARPKRMAEYKKTIRSSEHYKSNASNRSNFGGDELIRDRSFIGKKDAILKAPSGVPEPMAPFEKRDVVPTATSESYALPRYSTRTANRDAMPEQSTTSVKRNSTFAPPRSGFPKPSQNDEDSSRNIISNSPNQRAVRCKSNAHVTRKMELGASYDIKVIQFREKFDDVEEYQITAVVQDFDRTPNIRDHRCAVVSANVRDIWELARVIRIKKDRSYEIQLYENGERVTTSKVRQLSTANNVYYKTVVAQIPPSCILPFKNISTTIRKMRVIEMSGQRAKSANIAVNDSKSFNFECGFLNEYEARSQSKLYPKDQILMTGDKVTIASFTSPLKIYVNRVCDGVQLDRLHDYLNIFFEESNEPSVTKQPVMDDIVAVKGKTEEYFRGKVVKRDDCDRYHIFTLDFGDILIVDLADIKEIPDEFLRAPCYAIQVELSNCEDLNLGKPGQLFMQNLMTSKTEMIATIVEGNKVNLGIAEPPLDVNRKLESLDEVKGISKNEFESKTG